jgi:hypothetical protein
MRSSRRLVACAAALGLALACASNTRIVDQWSAPGLEASDLAFEHVVAIAIMQDETRRRAAEDAVARMASRTKVTPGYQILGSADRADAEQVAAALARRGIDGAITMRLIDVEEEQTWVPGYHRYVYPGGFYGYYGHLGAYVYEPGYLRTDRYVRIETTLYDVRRRRLLWAGVSETWNPRDVDEIVEGVVQAARRQLADDGLLP